MSLACTAPNKQPSVHDIVAQADLTSQLLGSRLLHLSCSLQGGLSLQGLLQEVPRQLNHLQGAGQGCSTIFVGPKVILHIPRNMIVQLQWTSENDGRAVRSHLQSNVAMTAL